MPSVDRGEAVELLRGALYTGTSVACMTTMHFASCKEVLRAAVLTQSATDRKFTTGFIRHELTTQHGAIDFLCPMKSPTQSNTVEPNALFNRTATVAE